MSVEVGKILKGTVTGITKFGAFIKLPEGETGLCHISEISDGYVKEVSDYLTESQEVTVKVLEVKDGKISLSIKQASEGEGATAKPKKAYSNNQKTDGRNNRNYGSKPNQGGSRPNQGGSRSNQGGSRSYNDSRKKGQGYGRDNKGPASYGGNSSGSQNHSGDFEDMMSSYLKTSTEKLKTVKKVAKTRKGNGYNR